MEYFERKVIFFQVKFVVSEGSEQGMPVRHRNDAHLDSKRGSEQTRGTAAQAGLGLAVRLLKGAGDLPGHKLPENQLRSSKGSTAVDPAQPKPSENTPKLS